MTNLLKWIGMNEFLFEFEVLMSSSHPQSACNIKHLLFMLLKLHDLCVQYDTQCAHYHKQDTPHEMRIMSQDQCWPTVIELKRDN